MTEVLQQGGSGSDSRVELISSTTAVIAAFALTRVTMSAVILGTLLIGGFAARDSAEIVIQIAVSIAAIIGIVVSGRAVVRQSRARAMSVGRAWAQILLDSILAVGVMALIDAETSPLAWVALITPVLETAVFFSIARAGFVWVGLSLGFLALRLVTNVSDDATTDTLILSIQQVLAVLFISGPAALMADSAEQRIAELADARRSADQTSQHLRRVAESARRMSREETLSGILAVASHSAASLGFDRADVVVRNSTGELTVNSIDARGEAASIAPEILSSKFDGEMLSVSRDDHTHGEALRLAGFDSGYGFVLSFDAKNGESDVVLRGWMRDEPASHEVLRSASLLAGHAREAYRARQLLSKAQTHADQLLHEVRHDSLTGLANRAYMLEAIEERIEMDEPMALLFIDLDKFKAINDSRGHRAGDTALVEVAKRLLETKRNGELVGRMGGDEFCVLTPLTAFDNLTTLQSYGDEIVASLSRPIEIDGAEADLGASIGIAVHDGDAGPDQFINAADEAMYEAKRSGGGTEVSKVTVDMFGELEAS